MVRCASAVTRIRQRPVPGPLSAGGVSKCTPSDLMSRANAAPSASSRTLPTKAALPPSDAIPATVFAAEPPETSAARPIAA